MGAGPVIERRPLNDGGSYMAMPMLNVGEVTCMCCDVAEMGD